MIKWLKRLFRKKPKATTFFSDAQEKELIEKALLKATKLEFGKQINIKINKEK